MYEYSTTIPSARIIVGYRLPHFKYYIRSTNNTPVQVPSHNGSVDYWFICMHDNLPSSPPNKNDLLSNTISNHHCRDVNCILERLQSPNGKERNAPWIPLFPNTSSSRELCTNASSIQWRWNKYYCYHNGSVWKSIAKFEHYLLHRLLPNKFLLSSIRELPYRGRKHISGRGSRGLYDLKIGHVFWLRYLSWHPSRVS